MEELFEKHKISHINTSDGKVFMIHETALQDIAEEYLNEQLRLGAVVGQSEQLKAFVDWWHGLSQEELAWYEGRYVEVFLSL